MNLKNRLRHLAAKSSEVRMYGKTTLLARIASELQAVFLTADIESAKEIKRKFKLSTRSIDTNLDGVSGPFIFDHYAVERLLERAADKIEQLEKENQALKSKLGEEPIVVKNTTIFDFGDV